MVDQEETVDRIRLFDLNAEPLLASNRLPIGEGIPTDALRRVMRTAAPEALYQREHPAVLSYLVPLRSASGQVAGAMEIVRVTPLLAQRLRAANLDVVFRVGILVIVIVVVTAIVMQRQVVRPLARLTRSIQSFGHGEPDAALPVSRRDELGRVAEAFNEMAVRLRASQQELLSETERALELEAELRRAATLAVAGKLASSLAHEVGTPLNIIAGRAEFVLKKTAVDATAREDLETIIGQIDRISKIIGSLLDTVRPHRPDLRPAAVAEVFEGLLPLLEHAARQRDVTLDAEVDGTLPTLMADVGQLRQVMINLVMNAVDAIIAPGSISVSAAPLEHEGHPGVAFRVRDSGPGIPPDVLGKMFEPFFTTKPRGQGTGLGLAICRDIVIAHRGDIRVETWPGGGTAFTVWIPAAPVGAA